MTVVTKYTGLSCLGFYLSINSIFKEKVLYFSLKMKHSERMQAIENKILSRIYGRGRGWAFTASDFTHEFKRPTVDWSLHHLVGQRKIRRVCRGVYDYPRYSEFLEQELSPEFDQVAQALARKFKWRIQASGDAALNLLGLSTQVPSKINYLSDGPDRSYQFGKVTLYFEQSALKEIGFKYRESGLIVHALKALGRENIDQKVKQKIREQLNSEKRIQILKDTKTVTGWVQEIILEICKVKS